MPVVLPEKGMPRERWLTRSEAARLVWAAWRLTQRWKGQESDRRTGQHVARFILVGLYTGTRAGAICNASFVPREDRGYVDLERGVFYRRVPSARPTKKRQTPCPIPRGLLAHMRRWRNKRICHEFVVEWSGDPVGRVSKAFRRACVAAGLGEDVTPHTLRHTAATWLLQSGVEPWEAAGYLGMTTELIEAVYGHHSPNHLAGARDASSKPGRSGSPTGTDKNPEKSDRNKRARMVTIG